jgi:putative ABC transport system permease protein
MAAWSGAAEPVTAWRDLVLALRLARRELRGGVRGFRIVLACLALGVAAIAGVGSLRAGLEAALAAEGRRLLGGDIEIETGATPVPEALTDWLAARGIEAAPITTMRALLAAPSGERQLVELKAVAPRWPLIGAARFAPQGTPADILGGNGIAAESIVLDRLGLKPGARVRLGNAEFTLRAALAAEPDAVSTPMLAPRVLIALDALPATGLDAPGALVRHAVRLRLPAGMDAGFVAAALRAEFPGSFWRLRGPADATPQISRVIAMTGQFMTLVGLTALLVGGIGVANGTRAWLAARTRTLASLRCLGAPARLVAMLCLAQILVLAALGTLIGLLVGAALPAAAWLLPEATLPVRPQAGLHTLPLALAAAFGLLTAIAFALAPLARAARIPGAALFRPEPPGADRCIGWRARAAVATLGLALAALTVAVTPDRAFAAWFCAGAAGSLLVLRLVGAALPPLAAALPRPTRPWTRPWTRLGLDSLSRRGSPAPQLVVSIGLGLATLAAVALIQGNLHAQVAEHLPARAPTFFFVDIQPEQMDRFAQVLAAENGVGALQHVPSLRGRIVAVNGVPAEQVQATPETQWALRGDRGLTYAAAMPEGTRLVAGSWWPADYRGKPLVSFDAALAAGWGVKLGDTIRVNVLGREFDLTVANLREIAWRSLGINFALVVSPGLLEGAPHTHIATVHADAAAQGRLLRAVGEALPNVTGIRVEEVLRSLAAILDQLAWALGATGGITLAAGMLVLAGAVAAGQARRIREAVLLKTLGASRRQIRAAWLLEFGAVGLLAGLAAAAIGSAAAWAVVRFVMRAEFVFQPGRLALTLAGAVALMLVAGYIGTARALAARAAPLLRNE